MKIAATSAEEASKYAESALKECQLQPGEEMPAEFVNSMGMTQVISSMLLGVRPENDPKEFDMRGAEFEKFLPEETAAKAGA